MPQIRFILPATSANLGPGFDCLGIALNLYNEFIFHTAEAYSWHFKPEGVKISSVFLGAQENLVVKAYQHSCHKNNWPEKPFHVESIVRIPFESGLGSSATAIIAGVAAAYAFQERPLDRNLILKDAFDLEAHLDNITATIHGGFTCAFMGAHGCQVVKTEVSEDLKVFIAHPDRNTNTEESRQALPKTIPMSEVVQSLSHAVTFVAALIRKDYGIFYEAMLDSLHEPFRIDPALHYPELKQKLTGQGFYGWCLSGSGPSILLFTQDHRTSIYNLLQTHFTNLKIPVTIRPLLVDNQGMRYQL